MLVRFQPPQPCLSLLRKCRLLLLLFLFLAPATSASGDPLAKGWQALSARRWQEALRFAGRAMASRRSGARRLMASIHRARASGYSGEEKYRALAEAARFAPDSTELLVATGEAAYAVERLPEAVVCFDSAIARGAEGEALFARRDKALREAKSEKGFGSIRAVGFVVKFEGGEKKSLADRALAILDRARYELRDKLGFFSKEPMTLVIYTGERYRSVAAVPDWSAGYFDGKLRVREGDFLAEERHLRDLLYHEYVHALLFERCGGRIPAWFNEGLAQYYEPGKEWTGRHSKYLEDALASGSLLSLDRLGRNFGGLEVVSVRLAYLESLGFVEHLASIYGAHSFRQMVGRLHKGEEFPAAFRSVYARKIEEAEKSWRETLR